MRLTRLTKVQFAVLSHLVMRGHAATGPAWTADMGRKYIGVDTWNALREFGYVRVTDQGFIATDAGKVRAQEGYGRVV